MKFSDDKIQNLLRAAKASLEQGWIEPEAIPYLDQDTESLSATQEHQLWKTLRTRRLQLKKAGFELPTTKTFTDRILVDPVQEDLYHAYNLTKDTLYEMTRSSEGTWECSCEAIDNCKHLRALNALLHPEVSTADTSGSNPWQSYANVKLNPDQLNMLEGLDQWYAGSEPMIRVLGPAGTGKSTVIMAFLKRLLDQNRESAIRVVMASSFNKAVKVVMSLLQENGLKGVEATTLTKLLGLKESREEDKLMFRPIPGVKPPIEQYRLVIVDEASTISKDMWGYILKSIDQADWYAPVRIIFMGDPYQLPPVNEGESQAIQHKMPQLSMSWVMRHSGPILEYVSSIRENITSRPYTPDSIIANDYSTGLWSVEHKRWIELMEQSFASDNFQTTPNHSKAIAWTNARVGYLNHRIRRAMGFISEGSWAIGERIIAQTPYFTQGKGECLLTNSQEATVTAVSVGTLLQYEVYLLRLITDLQAEVTVPVIHEDSLPKYQEKLRSLSKDRKWGSFWDLKELFADITYAYALTAHKSQGSTYLNVWIDLPNFLTNRRTIRAKLGKKTSVSVPEAAQLAYVGASRAKQRLFILKGAK